MKRKIYTCIYGLVVLSFFTLLSCQGKFESSNPNDLDSSFTSSAPGGKIVAREFLHLSWSQFISNIDTTSFYSTEQLASFLPFSIELDSDRIVISNKYSEELRVYDKNGGVLQIVSYSGFNIDLVKFHFDLIDETLYLLDANRGLFVINLEKELLYSSSNTIDFSVSPDGNIFFKNSFEGKTAILDKRGILKKPLPDDYSTEFIEGDKLVGLKFLGPTFDFPFKIERVKLSDGVKLFQSPIDSLCISCFDFPRFVSSNIILASDLNSKQNHVYSINSNGDFTQYLLETPISFEPYLSVEYTPYYNLGWNYVYKHSSKELFAIGCEKNGITIFVYDLNEI